MSANRVVALLFMTLSSWVSAQAVTINTVPIGNPGNPADTRYIDSFHPNGVGSVGDAFRIGKTEVTNAQYVEFLNAVAASDLYKLYIEPMTTETWGGIERYGSPGSYTYAVKAPALNGNYTYEDKPVSYVSWADAARFVNWLHNGQPIGPQNLDTTETGAYRLFGATTEIELRYIQPRTADARWWLPTEDEWYKAAYYNPSAGVYYDYPMGTNSTPNNNLPSSDTGNSANFYDGSSFPTGDWEYPMTDAGAYTLSRSPYGTFDQGGNVMEMTETMIQNSFRSIRGGVWAGFTYGLHASYWESNNAWSSSDTIGFRVASTPEPSALPFMTIAGVGLFRHRRKLR